MPKTKIICTLGPASNNPTIIRKMMVYGMDIVRLNFSHGTGKEHLGRIKIVRDLNKKYRRAIKILQDLEGYRIRIGEIKQPLLLKKRQIYYLVQGNTPCQDKFIPFDYQGSLDSIKKGQFIYIDDGRIILKVISRETKTLKVEVVIGGLLYPRKGINIPGFKFKGKGLTLKDKKDLDFAFKFKPDFIAQSFVRGPEDILSLRRFIKGRLPDCKIIAKIENKEGVENIDKIIEVSDLIMVARGDLGICLPIYEVIFFQKNIIKKCKQAKKKVIVATQMLESMTENFIPTRAEVSDVANAILDGADFVMLSSETAKGKYPAEAVKVMNEIIKYTESHPS